MELSKELKRRVLTDHSFRSELRANPRGALESHMGPLANKTAAVKTHENSAKRLHFVLPDEPLDPETNSAEIVEIVARAQRDKDFRQQLLQDPRKVVEKQLAVELPAHMELVVMADTEDVIHVVIPSMESGDDDGGGEPEDPDGPDEPDDPDGPDDPESPDGPEEPEEPEDEGWGTINWGCEATVSDNTCSIGGIGFCSSTGSGTCESMAGGSPQCHPDDEIENPL